jgi:flagellar biosynthesis chaperone FliJ
MDYGSGGLNLGNSSSSNSNNGTTTEIYNIIDNSDATFMQVDLNENVGIGKQPSGYKLDVNGGVNANNFFKNGVELPTIQGITSSANQSDVIQLSNTTCALNTQLKINRSATDGDLAPPIYIVQQSTVSNVSSIVEGIKITQQRPDTTSYEYNFGPSIAFCNQNLNGTENRMAFIAGVCTDSSDIRSGGIWITTNKAGSGTRRMTLNHDGRLCLGVNVINPTLTESMMEILTSSLQGWSSTGRIAFVHSKMILGNTTLSNTCDINYNQSLSRLEISRPLYVSGDIYMNSSNKVATESYVNTAITTGGSAQANQILPSGYTFTKDVNSELHLDSTETNEKINFDLPVQLNNTLTSSASAITTLNGDTNINKAKLITIDNNSSNGVLEFKSADGAKKVQFIYDSVNNTININSNPTLGSSLIKTDYFRCNDYQFVNYTNPPSTSSTIPNLKVSNNTLYFQNSTGVQIMATKSYVDSLAGSSSNMSLSAISITPSATTQMIKLSVNSASNALAGYGISQGFYIDDPNIIETQVGKIEVTKLNDVVGNTSSEMGLYTHDGTDLVLSLKMNKNDITVYKNVVPNADNVIDLGSSVKRFNDVFSNNIVSRYVKNSTDLPLDFLYNTTTRFIINSSGVELRSNINVNTDNTYNIGSSSLRLATVNTNVVDTKQALITGSSKIHRIYTDTNSDLSFEVDKGVVIGDTRPQYKETVKMKYDDTIFDTNIILKSIPASSRGTERRLYVYGPNEYYYSLKTYERDPNYPGGGYEPINSDLYIETNTLRASDTFYGPMGRNIRASGMNLLLNTLQLENRTTDYDVEGCIWLRNDAMYWKSFKTGSTYAGKVNKVSSSEVAVVKSALQLFMTSSYEPSSKAITFQLDPVNSELSESRISNNEGFYDTDIESVDFKVYDRNIMQIKRNASEDSQLLVRGANSSLLRLACDDSSSALFKFEKTGYSNDGLTFSIDTNNLIRINNDGLRVMSGELICNNIDTNSTTSLLLKANNTNKLSLNNNDITVYQDLLPNTDDTLSLGGSNNYFSSGFINNINVSTLSNSTQINMNVGGGTKLSLSATTLTCSVTVIPSGSRNLGTSTARWDNIHYNNLVSASDKNLKDNIETCIFGLEFLKNVEPVSYIWRDGGHRKHIGYIAQQVEETLNNFGLNMSDWAIVGTSNNEYHLKYLEFIPILHNAILQLNNKVDAFSLSQDINKDIVKLNSLDTIKRRDSNHDILDLLETHERKICIMEDTQMSIITDINDVLNELKLENETLRNENDVMKQQMEQMQNELNEFKEQLKELLKQKEQPPQQVAPKTTTNGRLTIRQSNLTPNTTLKSDNTSKIKTSLFGSSKK